MQPAHAWVVLLVQCCSGFLQFVVPWEEVPSSWLSVRVLGTTPSGCHSQLRSCTAVASAWTCPVASTPDSADNEGKVRQAVPAPGKRAPASETGAVGEVDSDVFVG